MSLVLASGSPYRQRMLAPLFPDIQVDPAAITETAHQNEPAPALAARLAREKAEIVAGRHNNAVIIGCDQVGELLPGDDSTTAVILGKPRHFDAAREQLRACQGQWVVFHSACTVINAATQHAQHCLDNYAIRFRALTNAEIDEYLRREEPYDCAGSIKTEGMGSALIAEHRGNDPATLLGLPMIQLLDLLATEQHWPLK